MEKSDIGQTPDYRRYEEERVQQTLVRRSIFDIMPSKTEPKHSACFSWRGMWTRWKCGADAPPNPYGYDVVETGANVKRRKSRKEKKEEKEREKEIEKNRANPEQMAIAYTHSQGYRSQYGTYGSVRTLRYQPIPNPDDKFGSYGRVGGYEFGSEGWRYERKSVEQRRWEEREKEEKREKQERRRERRAHEAERKASIARSEGSASRGTSRNASINRSVRRERKSYDDSGSRRERKEGPSRKSYDDVRRERKSYDDSGSRRERKEHPSRKSYDDRDRGSSRKSYDDKDRTEGSSRKSHDDSASRRERKESRRRERDDSIPTRSDSTKSDRKDGSRRERNDSSAKSERKDSTRSQRTDGSSRRERKDSTRSEGKETPRSEWEREWKRFERERKESTSHHSHERKDSMPGRSDRTSWSEWEREWKRLDSARRGHDVEGDNVDERKRLNSTKSSTRSERSQPKERWNLEAAVPSRLEREYDFLADTPIRRRGTRRRNINTVQYIDFFEDPKAKP